MTELTLGLLAAPRDGANGAIVLVIQMLAIFGIFYFLLIRPQRKEQERHRQMIEALGKGTEIITTGGVIGKVVEAADDRLTIESAGSRLVVDRARVARVISGPGAPAAAPAVAKSEDAAGDDKKPVAGGRGGQRGSTKGGRR